MGSLKVFSVLLAVAAVIFYFTTFGWAFIPILTLFTFGTIWFWGLFLWANLALLIFIDSVELRDDYIGSATFTFILTALALHFLGGFQFSSYLNENSGALITFVVGYGVIGIVYSFWKWRLFVRKQRRKYDELRVRFFNDHDLKGSDIPDELLEDWKRYITHSSDSTRLEIKPQASRFKKKIAAWGCYWPWSFLWSVLNDPIKRFFLMVFRYLQGVYQRISERAFRGTETDFRELTDEQRSEVQRKKAERQGTGRR